ncbi:MAG: polysulfide reductase NrfD [Proteobacteria bacterium]|nr:polysulfide reductase NrfD [Pseudomonadota bacterium]
MNYGFLIDTGSCIGCHACSTACKSENQVPLGVNRTWVKTVEVGRYPDVTRQFQVTRCNHCSNPPCVRICPVTAMYQRNDGIVEFDPDVCIGCKGCIQACPYDAIYMDPDTHTAQKCHFCAHRVDVGQEPACVVVCPEHAILAGDLDDPESEISRAVATKKAVTVRKPEQGTGPKLYYVNGSEIALHPSATEPGASFMNADVLHPGPSRESEPIPPSGQTSYSGAALRSGQPQGTGNILAVGGNAAGQMVQVGWNAQHQHHWHWQIPAYIVTKGAAGGAALMLGAAALATTGSSGIMAVGGLFVVLLMLVTTGLLIYDLERPERFLLILARPQWRSWIARAAWILTGFSITFGLWWALELAAFLGMSPPSTGLRIAFAALSFPLGLATGTYTAFLFAQAEGRDFWQSPVTAVHMLLQTVYLGGLLTLASSMFASLPDGWAHSIGWLTMGTLALSAVALLAELHTPRASDTAARAQHAIRTEYRREVYAGGLGLGLALPLLLTATGSPFAALLALVAAGAGLFAYQLAYVTAPQRIPNS